MAYATAMELYHNFPKLAEESGFTFNIHRPRIHVEWHKIRLIDVENLIRERRFSQIEHHVNDILNCVLESEFDVRILDEGVLKIFRLAQLTVEYQQFCRHYLDRSVYVLREEINTLAQELDTTKKNLREREEEIRKLKRKSKHLFRTPLPYGNDNIATMILKTLNNKSDVFPSSSHNDTIHYNKCNYCDKVFLNQLYLTSHISRRHPNVMEIPQKDTDHSDQINQNENTKLNNEIIELKNKLQQMEVVISKSCNPPNQSVEISSEKKKNIPQENKTLNETKDVEVATDSENGGYILDKIEEWKKEEHEKYNKEINLLRNQILSMINESNKEKDNQSVQNELKLMEQLHATIKQQGVEIQALRQELINSQTKIQDHEPDKSLDFERQMSYWAKRAEIQSSEYKTLLQKLNGLAKQAEESRARADAETERAAELEELLRKTMQSSQSPKTKDTCTTKNRISQQQILGNDERQQSIKKMDKETSLLGDRFTFDKLHQKAQELLKLEQISTSDSSSTDSSEEMQLKPMKQNNASIVDFSVQAKSMPNNIKTKNTQNKLEKPNKNYRSISPNQNKHTKKAKVKKISHISTKKPNGTVIPGSPMKLVRAKITEEVNQRIASLGVDPLKNRLPQSLFLKQRMKLQEEHEVKVKKNPSREKVWHSLIAHLDSNIGSNEAMHVTDSNVSPNKLKSFSISNVFSNVKSKALSLVKSNEMINKPNAHNAYEIVAKKAMSLLKTPPGSSAPSPKKENRSHVDSPIKQKHIKKGLQDNRNKSPLKVTTNTQSSKLKSKEKNKDVFDIESTESDDDYFNKALTQSSKSIDNLIKSPIRRPSQDKIYDRAMHNSGVNNFSLKNGNQAANDLKSEVNNILLVANNNSSDDVESLEDSIPQKLSAEHILNLKQTKSVLKNASSTSSLNKKKVLFDMDAIQMKSLSASPSQSITEKNDTNENYEVDIVNIEGEEWDLSSVENEHLHQDTKIKISTRTSPKIAELKQAIEAQLTHRNQTPSTALVGSVDVLRGPMVRATSIGGSNTSLGSSILDETDSLPVQHNKTFVTPKTVSKKDDSELDLSELLGDGIDKIDQKAF